MTSVTLLAVLQVHHPLSEDQLEEVWEEQDHMSRDSFDPETFFRMHGRWRPFSVC